jgi:uncharacterized protein (UPF0335 family)
MTIGHNSADGQSLTDYARRMRNLVEEDRRIAADLRELAKEMRGVGYQAVVLKSIVVALVAAEEGDEKPLEKLKARTQEVAMYADALGTPIDGFGEGERNRFGVNESDETPHDPDTGEVIEHDYHAKAEANAPAPEHGSGEDLDHVAKDAGQSASRLSGGSVNPRTNSEQAPVPRPEPVESREAGTVLPDVPAVAMPAEGKTAANLDPFYIEPELRRTPA